MQPVQLRLGFPEPGAPVSLRLTLSGLRVVAETSDPQLAWTYLEAAGANPDLSGTRVSFPAAQFHRVADLPGQVAVSADRSLAALLLLATHPSEQGRPAELTYEGRSLWLRWFDGTVEHHEPVLAAASGVLLTCDLPFVATPAAFDAMQEANRLPVLVGRAQVNHDGFIEILTSKPQMVELAPLPGLFRLDGTRFGLALPYAEALAQTPGFAWASSAPILERGPSVLPSLPMPLSAHVAADLRRLVDSLASYGTQAVVWGSGLGRRVFALSAVDTLDAWPLLVVCTPATVWAWQRHMELFGRTSSLTHADADAHIITYEELAALRPRTSPQTVIFDDLGAPGVLNSTTLAALRRLDSMPDTYRLAISSQWPADPAAVVEVMSVLRPAEFRPGTPLATRYPGDSQAGLTAHVRAYIAARPVDAPGNDTRQFRRSSVVKLNVTPAQRRALEESVKRHGYESPAALLVEALEVSSCGPSLALSPKIAAVVERAERALAAGRRVAVVTRHRRTATLVTNMLRTPETVSVEASSIPEGGVPRTRLAVLRFDRELPDLRWFDDVLVVDFPWSWAVLDDAVGSPADQHGPTTVTVFHLSGSVDDRLTMLAARRKQLGPVIDQGAPPDAQEIERLLDVVRNPPP